jgi:hypothetical protein
VARIGGDFDRIDDTFSDGFTNNNLDFQFWGEIDVVVGTTIDLFVALLPTIALLLRSLSFPHNTERTERLFDLFQSIGSDDTFQQLHRIPFTESDRPEVQTSE